MRRRLFLTLGGATLAAPHIVTATRPTRVLIVGAGAAGLTAAHHLTTAGVDAQVVDAAPYWGGRIAKITTLSDIPLDIGAEWIHGAPTLLGEILGQGATDLGIDTFPDSPKTFDVWHNDRLTRIPTPNLDTSPTEHKFHTTTWYDFFDRFIATPLAAHITLNAQVREITHDRRGVTATLGDGSRIDADHILVTTPLSVLQNGAIRFSPALPKSTTEGLQTITFGAGFKLFLRFKTRFYPDAIIAGPLRAYQDESWTENLFYDAALGKPTTDHILGLFSAAPTPLPRARLSDAAMISDVLKELDRMYNGAASQSFLQGVAQNWTKNPYIMGSYAMDSSGDTPLTTLLASRARLHFAGEAMGGEHQSTVHGAAFSAIRAVQTILHG
ncbi:NAD(P)-binding Rossmann-like domain-containing protein [Pseudorhodobacter antarcticus]|uniref:Tryptophan 2-monooxygenase n=1 Tax=Pseudorhodobacter antarcticus TaxID=1077947 RepID=A0A1H8LA99_9RHOB|nr:NAD(P)/FAD-dependent oxidoreductase [Pseudorhodobacter antarcticus]SEO02110.1 NAD(P)-binding Rossmann-like domain-containing protein [Pseudorhodobacter antarcticus]